MAELLLEAGSPGPRVVLSPPTLVPTPPFPSKVLYLGLMLSACPRFPPHPAPRSELGIWASWARLVCPSQVPVWVRQTFHLPAV